ALAAGRPRRHRRRPRRAAHDLRALRRRRRRDRPDRRLRSLAHPSHPAARRSMTTAAIGSPSRRTASRLGAWLSVRHSLRILAAGAVALYGLYEVGRGLVGTAAA